MNDEITHLDARIDRFGVGIGSDVMCGFRDDRDQRRETIHYS